MNNKVLSGGQLAGGNSTSRREENDFYATDPETLKLFCDSWYDPAIKGCNNCPLINLDFTDCREAYIHYLLNKGEVE